MDRWVDGWREGGRGVGGEWGRVEGGEFEKMSGLLGGVVIVLLSVCETKSFPN